MAGRPSNRASQTQAIPPASARQNEYFVPRDGIDREVITSDICRYLGNDALVRPGTYESPDGRVTQGYYITAYRNLTSAMIQDLKADSARWEQERRAASRSAGGAGGTMHSSQSDGMFVRRNSNSPAGSREQPRGQGYSAWKNQQREQQLGFEAQYGSAMDIDYAPATGAAATPVYANQQYAGAAPANYPPATYPPQAHAVAAQYQAQPGYGYPQNPPPAQYSPQPQTSGDRYPGIPPPPIAASYGQDAGAFVHGSNYQAAGGYAAPGPRMPPNLPHASAAPSRTYPAPTTGTPVYGSETDPYGYQPPTGNPPTQAFPTDALYGRSPAPAGTTQRPGYTASPDPQYDAHQNPALQSATTPTTTAPAQMASGNAPPPRRERDSEPRDREPRERDHRDHRPRRSEPEREDRDRNRHRHR
ncbi:hypothetical protein C8A01DRAFT_17276 [Parachaetomium inaequale]|uniref:Transcription factor RfeG n=1 Tax=Parachaetomium inaequale TaxID=2588326 RepID=A0AAN6PD10_9PEZI|nr:hypothetical protein C8A01DRAFT_17276 [Parachaetomium inaequale]